MKNLMVGNCAVCGKKHVRPSPANVAVCAPNHAHAQAVEVPLKPQHPSFRYELRKREIPAIEIVGETCAKPQPKKKQVFSSDGKSMWYEDAKE